MRRRRAAAPPPKRTSCSKRNSRPPRSCSPKPTARRRRPFMTCLRFWDGAHWRVVVDTSEVGDLAACSVLENYRVAQRYASFGDRERIHFGVNVYDDGNVVSIVVESGYHGTHVAGIVAGNYPDAPERNGVAPGAQIVSLKIGDSRMHGMESHQGVVRALNHLLPASLEDPSTPPHAAQHKVTAQVANMSYGEPTAFPNAGRIVELLTALAREAGVLFLASAGNAGPGLSTVGSPGGTTDAIIGVGAYVTPGLATQAYSLLPDGLVSPSPGAMSADGYPPAGDGLTPGGGGAARPQPRRRAPSSRPSRPPRRRRPPPRPPTRWATAMRRWACPTPLPPVARVRTAPWG
eukprot:TRINITY_DN1384_c0_g1_i2.p1 TRINITY_DN1384_c0_g1~~TRINITY_DN1384_c0_g1_i2.p1  ORF type:complete len:348 (-),score=88.10 TRINITY_DN1384_c0_g1_i2:454-1497(-)